MGRYTLKAIGLLAVIAILVMTLLPTTTRAHVTTACRFYGVVTVDGLNVPPGTVVTVWLDGPIGPWTTTTYTRSWASWYVIDIPADDPATPEKDGGVAGDIVQFSVTHNGRTISGPSAPWQRTKFVYHPLRLTTPPFIPGDADGDGDVDVADIIKVERIIAGLDDPTPGADANGDGVINMGDVIKIELIILGIDP